jgi:hypothetical protein
MVIPLFDADHIALISPLSPDESVRRLRDAVEDNSTSGPPAVIGEIGEHRFRLRKRLPPFTKNSFQTFLHGKISTDSNGTRVDCRIGLHPFVAIFMALWFVLLWAGGLFAIAVIATGPKPMTALIPAAIIGCMTIGGIIMVIWARGMAKGERPFLLDFVRRVVDAHIVGGQEAATVQRQARR